jgi:hypothetical protein
MAGKDRAASTRWRNPIPSPIMEIKCPLFSNLHAIFSLHKAGPAVFSEHFMTMTSFDSFVHQEMINGCCSRQNTIRGFCRVNRIGN